MIATTIFITIATLILSFAGISSSHPPLTFFVIGDWGRQGTWNQSQVAALMGEVGGVVHPSFIISTGDNMYPNGLNSTNDPLFEQSFSGVYRAPALQVRRIVLRFFIHEIY